MRCPVDRVLLAATLLVAASGCRPSSAERTDAPREARRLPTGRVLDPAAPSYDLNGAMPLGVALSPDGRRAAVLVSGWRRQGIDIVDLRARRVVQSLDQRAAFVGLALAPDGRTLYASGGNQDVVYRYDWDAGGARLRDSLVLAARAPDAAGTRYPAGLGVSPDGRFVYVAENLADSLAVLDAATGRVCARFATERYPYGVAVAPDGTVYVSAWGGRTVAVFAPAADGVVPRGAIDVGRHPSALLLDRAGTRLFVASASTDRVSVVDTRRGAVIAELRDPPPAGPDEGTTPNGLALSADGTRLYVAEADANAIAVFELGAATANVAGAAGRDSLVGRIPVDWYPTLVVSLGAPDDSLLVLTGKGRGTAANPDGPGPMHPIGDPGTYTLGQLRGTFAVLPAPGRGAALEALSARASRANGWTRQPTLAGAPPAITHVIYVIKENRTYDQVLGDLPVGDGDTSLVLFGRDVTPNHHALAERFGVWDRFFVNAEVSADGHNWSMAAYAGDYVEKTVASNYSSRGRTYDYQGTNRTDEDRLRIGQTLPDDDVNEPANGYLWNLVERAGISFRNYGEFTIGRRDAEGKPLPGGWRGAKPFLARHTDPDYPGWDLGIPDQQRADAWVADTRRLLRAGGLPALEIVYLPNDHTAGMSAGGRTPRAYVADNDLALGRVIEELSRTPAWDSTVVFVLEDDAQDGPDHVDSHRSPLLVISPWARAGVHHRWANTTDVLATIAELLHLGSLSHFDHFGEPLRGIWRDAPDARPYAALVPAVPLDERVPAKAPGTRESGSIDLREPDRVNDALFNRIIWRAVKGDAPYPGAAQLGPAGTYRMTSP